MQGVPSTHLNTYADAQTLVFLLLPKLLGNNVVRRCEQMPLFARKRHDDEIQETTIDESTYETSRRIRYVFIFIIFYVQS